MTACLPCNPGREATPHVYYTATKGLCGVCKRQVDGKIQFRNGAVYMQKFCTEHGRQECLVSSSVEWYLDALSFVAPSTPPRTVKKKVTHGCPHDCGPCDSHQQKVYLPVVPITSQCNLDCPICYTINKNENAFNLSREQFASILTHLKRDNDEIDIINFTGGEPTLHPELLELLRMAQDAGVKRLTISTNGLKLLDEAYVRLLAEVDARVILSLDTFDSEVDKILLGANTVNAKKKVLDLCARHDVTATILPAVAAGLNDKDVGPLLDLVLSRPNICSLELHTLTFTGEGGTGFARSARITIPDLHREIEKSTQGGITALDFVPSPLAHPHCYSICYLLMLDGGGFVPFTRLMPRARLFDLLQHSLYIEPGEHVDAAFRDIIDDLWAEPDKLPNSDAVLQTLKRLLRELFPSRSSLPLKARQKIAERAVKAVYIHSHMDEENFDVSRIMKCCVGVPEADGTNIPTCSYNVLYRERDRRFADDAKLERMGDARRRLPIVAPEAT